MKKIAKGSHISPNFEEPEVIASMHQPSKRKQLPNSDELNELIIHSLDADKAEDVITIDLAEKSTIADYMIVATGRSSRQVSAMADHLLRRLKALGFGNCQVEGLPQGDWVLIDAGDVIVHLFRPEVREFYNLEKMWSVAMPTDQVERIM
jgi:ribosome-associated protein